ncbi:MAG: hypothetical protein CMF74_05415 [Maricaulis sp.]|jgi:hypothetical protein|nr:hypothetical protein [Maricaulis sp.]HAQ35865.1 hypothetical protein [Alphaproteobacteria bacterium]|tara:strand:- start:321 stop:533 length:213 start_codon:yes stop_codon:yes gene_type:complete
MGEDFLDQDTLKARIAELRQEHRTLDGQIGALIDNGVQDQLKIARLKKEKLFLKDRISDLEDRMTPDIIA